MIYYENTTVRVQEKKLLKKAWSMKTNDNIINLYDWRTEATTNKPEIQAVIDSINQQYGLEISADDPRLEHFKTLFLTLEIAAAQKHSLCGTESMEAETKRAFVQGIEFGRAQMMTDLILAILEKDGLIEFS